MAIVELRLLPPLAIGRLGASETPLEAFDLEVAPERPLDFRNIVPQTTFEVDPNSGEIVREYVPERIVFKDPDRRIRPVAPFIEAYARTDEAPDELVPLTLDLLRAHSLSVADLEWSVAVANIKLFRRTGDAADKIEARVEALRDHARVPLAGVCENFLAGRKLPLGHVQFIRPTAKHPQIRFRFTPAAGKVYGSSRERIPAEGAKPVPDPIIDKDELILYDLHKGKWHGYKEGSGPTLTNPAQIFAGYQTAAGDQVSWGYLDDECDGYVRLSLRPANGKALHAQAHIGAGPPAFAPDTLPVRVVSDELEQILHGPTVDEASVPIEEAEELVRRALETVRLLNTAVMNGNAIDARQNVASTMVRQDTNDFSRYYEPIAAPSLVDNLALRALHERVFSALAAGGAAWFSEALRKPEEIGDLSDAARRKMPALMRGADGRGLTLTRRQIDLVAKAAAQAMFGAPPRAATKETP